MKDKKSLPPFEVMEKMSRGERQKVLDEQLKWLVAYAYEKAPATKERFDKAGIVPSKVSGIKDLENLPLLRKDDVGGFIQSQSSSWRIGYCAYY